MPIGAETGAAGPRVPPSALIGLIDCFVRVCPALPLILIGRAVPESSRRTTGGVYPAQGGAQAVPHLHRGAPVQEPQHLRRGLPAVSCDTAVVCKLHW